MHGINRQYGFNSLFVSRGLGGTDDRAANSSGKKGSTEPATRLRRPIRSPRRHGKEVILVRDEGGQPPKLDYDLEESITLTTPEQFAAAGDFTRQKILGLLLEQSATNSQLAEALARPKGTIGHHLKALERAGLIRVVRTRQVRAMTERYYGRVARTLDFIVPGAERLDEQFTLLRQAIREYAPSPRGDRLPVYTIRHARVPASEARAFADRILELAEEFDRHKVAGEPVYGFVAGVYRTDWPELPGTD